MRGNLTPVTEFVIAQLLAGLPADTWAAGKTKPLKSAALKEAASVVQALLASAGIAYTADPLAGPLAVGDEADLALDKLTAHLAAATTSLPQATAAVIVAAGGAPPEGVTLSSLPPAQLFAQAAAICPSLRSGRYHLVFEPPRVSRRPVGLSQAATSGV